MSFVMVGVSAFSQIQQGRDAKAVANMNAGQADYQAGVEEQSALQTAKLIRRQGQRIQSSANASYAASGVQLGSGSAAAVEEEIITGTEHDAYQALLEGGRRARGLRTEATLGRIGGKMAETAGYVNGINTALTGAYAGMKASGWRSQGEGFSGTQKPAPVVNRDYVRG
jgi:hypothetical protein